MNDIKLTFPTIQEAVEGVFDENNSVEINSLSEYIELMEKLNAACNCDFENCVHIQISEYLFRGEGSFYPKRVSGAFRTERHLPSLDLYPDFNKGIDEFYRSVGYRLSEIEKNNFVAFSQHYGLPTNLLDVTPSPLTALFMACYSEERNLKGGLLNDETPAYLYNFEEYESLEKIRSRYPNESIEELLKETKYGVEKPVYVYIMEHYIDVTDIVERYPEKSIIDLIIDQDEYTIKKMAELIEGFNRKDQFDIENKFRIYIKQLCKNILNFTNDSEFYKLIFEKSNAVCEFQNSEDNISKLIEHSRLLFCLANEINQHEGFTNIPLPHPQDSSQKLRYCYMTFLSCYLKLIKNNVRQHDGGEFMPYMIYRPKITFERARLQQGFFIIQPYVKPFDDNNDTRIRLVQEIEHSKIIKVNHPEKILRQLDSIGVNLGNMYGDYDSIAKYIKKKYL